MHPVLQMHAADQFETVLGQVIHHALPDDLPLVVARDELLGPARPEVGEAVDAQPGQQLERVGPFQKQLRHVVRLVEQHGALAPGMLLVAPVGEFRGNR